MQELWQELAMVNLGAAIYRLLDLRTTNIIFIEYITTKDFSVYANLPIPIFDASYKLISFSLNVKNVDILGCLKLQ